MLARHSQEIKTNTRLLVIWWIRFGRKRGDHPLRGGQVRGRRLHHIIALRWMLGLVAKDRPFLLANERKGVNAGRMPTGKIGSGKVIIKCASYC